MIADKIKMLRQSSGFTQTEVAKRLEITRSSVNAWEMGISVPSTQYIVELALLFHVSSDYLLDISRTSTVAIDGLSEKEIAIIVQLIQYFQNQNLLHKER